MDASKAALSVAIGLFGTCSNALMLWTLQRDSKLHDLLGWSTRVLLSAHATCDLLYSAVGLPLMALSQVFSHWSGWEFSPVCVVTALAVWQLGYTSQWYLTAMALSRTIATVWPIHFMTVLNESRSFAAVLVILPPVIGFSFQIASVWAGIAEVVTTESATCHDRAVEGTGELYYRLTAFVLLALPLALALYLALAYQLMRKRRATVSPADESPERAKQLARFRAFLLCFLVNLLLMAPLWVAWTGGFYFALERWSRVIAGLIGFTYLMAGVVNPLVYAVVSKDFRSAFRRTLCM